ncbi:MAG: helix-turn-helix transcriptional regulator [Chitinophagaceae bacterium]|nr:helix-turn-helix transcriptional regulator [Chitinophagaceae bacterium]
MGNFIAKNFKLLRELKGLNQAQISVLLGFNRSTWNNYETGKSKPNLDDLSKISKYFEVSLSELVELDLSYVNLNMNYIERKKQQNVNLNVNPHVNPNHKKEVNNKVNDDLPMVVNEGESGYLSGSKLIQARIKQ